MSARPRTFTLTHLHEAIIIKFISTRSTADAKVSSKTGEEVELFQRRSRRGESSARSPPPTSAMSDDAKSIWMAATPPESSESWHGKYGSQATTCQPDVVPTARWVWS